MSGGCFEYLNDSLCREVFRWGVTPVYGMGHKQEYGASVKEARKLNPMKDKILSEMLYDMFCLLHSFDLAESGDTNEELYRKDVLYFKQKWLKSGEQGILKTQIDAGIEELREELYRDLLWEDKDDT